MANRTVMKVNLECYKCRSVALQSITKIEGIETISINKKEQTITVEGDADPVCIANKLKKKFKCATIIFVSPLPIPPPPTKPPKENPKPEKEDPQKENGKKKGNEKPTPTPQKPVDPSPTVQNPFVAPYFIPVPPPYIMACDPCKPLQPCCCSDCSYRCHPLQPHTEVHVYNEENPSACTIS